MKKVLYGVAIIGLVMACISIVNAKDIKADLTINNDAALYGGKKKKTPVALSHKKHADKCGCMICHHEMKSDDDAEKAKAKSCAAKNCHGSDKGEKADKVNNLKSVYHANCWTDCHKKNKPKKVEGGPDLNCNDCHKK